MDLDLDLPNPDSTDLTAPAPTPPSDPYAMDSSQWDQDTRNSAALGDLHNMIDQHVQDYGSLPDSDTMNGFMDNVCDQWGTPEPEANGNGFVLASMANDNQAGATPPQSPTDPQVTQSSTVTGTESPADGGKPILSGSGTIGVSGDQASGSFKASGGDGQPDQATISGQIGTNGGPNVSASSSFNKTGVSGVSGSATVPVDDGTANGSVKLDPQGNPQSASGTISQSAGNWVGSITDTRNISSGGNSATLSGVYNNPDGGSCDANVQADGHHINAVDAGCTSETGTRIEGNYSAGPNGNKPAVGAKITFPF